MPAKPKYFTRVVKFKPRIKPGFLNLPPGSRVQENRGKSEGLSTLGSSSESRIKPGFFLYLTLSLSQALGQRLLCCPKRGTSGPPFLKVGEGRGAGARWAPFSARSPLPRRSVLDVCHWQTAPEAAAETSHRLPIHKKGGDARPQQGGTL